MKDDDYGICIETENLTKRYGTATVVNKVNLHLPKGKIYGLLGRKRAGKTTVMKMMLQLAFPTDGVTRLFGTNYEEDVRFSGKGKNTEYRLSCTAICLSFFWYQQLVSL